MAAKALVKSEKYLIHRRRLGLTQQEYANDLYMSLSNYRTVESGRSPRVATPRAPGGITFGSLSADERCLVLRRRAKLTQQQVADDIGVSRNWLNQMEQGKVDLKLLTDFWNL